LWLINALLIVLVVKVLVLWVDQAILLCSRVTVLIGLFQTIWSLIVFVVFLIETTAHRSKSMCLNWSAPRISLSCSHSSWTCCLISTVYSILTLFLCYCRSKFLFSRWYNRIKPIFHLDTLWKPIGLCFLLLNLLDDFKFFRFVFLCLWIFSCICSYSVVWLL